MNVNILILPILVINTLPAWVELLSMKYVGVTNTDSYHMPSFQFWNLNWLGEFTWKKGKNFVASTLTTLLFQSTE